MKFKIGEQVQLKSGGPVMTVAGVVQAPPNVFNSANGHIRCQWFSGKKLENGAFPAESLRKPVEEKP
jgi:uncharacterized protein YodC (DUF2158 family)